MLMFYLQLLETEEDKRLFEQLYESHRSQMHLVANYVLHDPDLAEDAVHIAFMGIIDNIQKLHEKNKEDVKNYVLKAAKNTAINLKKKERRQHDLFPELENEFDNVEDSVLEEMVTKENFEETVNAIMQIREPYNTVLYCYFVMEMNYDEIAKTLRRKPDTVRQQFHRGKSQLKALLKGVAN